MNKHLHLFSKIASCPSSNTFAQLAALSRMSTLQILSPKMVQLCVRILYAGMAAYKILKTPYHLLMF